MADNSTAKIAMNVAGGVAAWPRIIRICTITTSATNECRLGMRGCTAAVGCWMRGGGGGGDDWLAVAHDHSKLSMAVLIRSRWDSYCFVTKQRGPKWILLLLPAALTHTHTLHWSYVWWHSCD